MKKILQFLGIIIFLMIITVLIIGIFNPGGSRDKLITNAINHYLNIQIIPEKERVLYDANVNNNPLIPDEQEKALYDMGVDVASLPNEITPEMSACFIKKLGEARTMEIVNGATPSVIDFFKAKDCL